MKNKIKGLFVLALFISSIEFGLSQEKQKNNPINQFLLELTNDPLLSSGHFSYSVKHVKDTDIKFENHGNSGLIPASNIKLLTTAAALGILGPEYRYETTLEYTGNIENGVLNGDLYISGSGDPTLGSDRFSGTSWDMVSLSWANKIKAAGISKINGRIIGDGRAFDINPIPDGWVWTDMGNYFGAGVYGLNIFDNTYKLFFKPGKVTEVAQIVRTEPELPIKFINQVLTANAGTGDKAYIYGGPYSDFRIVSGTIPFGKNEFPIKGSIPDPVLLTAYSFQKVLQNNDIEVTQDAANIIFVDKPLKQEIRTVIGKHYSPELHEIVKQTNLYSINLYAESLFKSIGLKVFGKGTTENGIKAMNDYWIQKGLSDECFRFYDGSGLSLTNKVSTGFFVKALSVIAHEPYFNVFYESLPIAGKTGTLAWMCKGTAAENKLRAKSGTLKSVICYSGYVPDSKGELLAFSILVNNYNGTYQEMKKKVEKLMVLVSEL